MKRIALLLLCCGALLSASAQGIRFEHGQSWEQLKRKAAMENKFILVDVYATWCGPCKQMDREVYPDAALGDYVNSRFISVKVQQDKTDHDAPEIKAWYADAEKIQTRYKVDELPTFLFLNEKGELVHRISGFHDAPAFLDICKAAADPSVNFAGMLAQYKQGKVQGKKLLSLALKAKSYKEDSIALAIARTYRNTVLDAQQPETLMTPETAEMLAGFAEVYHVKDSLIQYIYKNQAAADKGMGTKDYAKRLSHYLIYRDVVAPAVDKPGKTPDWKKLQATVARSYDKRTAQEIVLPAKVGYYQKRSEWDKMITSWIEKMETIGVNMEDMFGGVEVNNTVYDVIFKHSKNPYALKKSIEYMEALLKVTPDSHPRLDTYAAVLYKSGQKEKAIEVERKALAIAEKEKAEGAIKEYQEIIEKMQQGKPTWE